VRPAVRTSGQSLYSATFDSSGSRLAVGGDERFSILDVPDLKPVTSVSLDSATSVQFSPDGRLLAVGTITSALHLWSRTSLREVATLRHPGLSEIHRIAFGGDGRVLAAATADSVSLLDLAGAHERLELSGHARGITASSFSLDGGVLATAGNDGLVRLWDATTGRQVRELAHTGSVQACRFSPDGRLFATGSMVDPRCVRVWETSQWTEVYSSGDTDTTAVEFSRDGSVMAASGDALRIWRVGRGAEGRSTFEKVLTKPTPRGLCVALSPDGRFAAYIVNNRQIRVWDLSRGRDVPFAGPTAMMGWHGLAFRSARELVYIGASGMAETWDVASGRKVRSVGAAGTFQSFHIAVSPDGRWLAAEATPWSVAVADLERGEVAFTFRAERSPVWSLGWSPDARRLAVGLSDGGLAIWDLREVRRLLAEQRLEEGPWPGETAD
jgi:WD40 repeat protein